MTEFLDMFSKNLPGMLPQQEIEFTIDEIPKTTPISKAPYIMAPTKLKELKEQF